MPADVLRFDSRKAYVRWRVTQGNPAHVCLRDVTLGNFYVRLLNVAEDRGSETTATDE